MKTPQQQWNERNQEVVAKATQKWKAKKIRIEFFLDPAEADSLLKMPGSRNGNAKRLLLEAMNGVENQGQSIGSPSR